MTTRPAKPKAMSDGVKVCCSKKGGLSLARKTVKGSLREVAAITRRRGELVHNQNCGEKRGLRRYFQHPSLSVLHIIISKHFLYEMHWCFGRGWVPMNQRIRSEKWFIYFRSLTPCSNHNVLLLHVIVVVLILLFLLLLVVVLLPLLLLLLLLVYFCSLTLCPNRNVLPSGPISALFRTRS